MITRTTKQQSNKIGFRTYPTSSLMFKNLSSAGWTANTTFLVITAVAIVKLCEKSVKIHRLEI